MSPICRSVMPVLALSGVLLSLSPIAQAGPPAWTAYGNGHSNYGSHRDDHRVDYYQGGRERGDYREHRAPREYYYERRNDQWRYGHYYRDDHRGYPYQGYRGSGWRNDYAVARNGRCGTDGVLTVAGAITGGIIGNHSASRGNRDVATVFGAVAGGILANAIGK